MDNTERSCNLLRNRHPRHRIISYHQSVLVRSNFLMQRYEVIRGQQNTEISFKLYTRLVCDQLLLINIVIRDKESMREIRNTMILIIRYINQLETVKNLTHNF